LKHVVFLLNASIFRKAQERVATVQSGGIRAESLKFGNNLGAICRTIGVAIDCLTSRGLRELRNVRNRTDQRSDFTVGYVAELCRQTCTCSELQVVDLDTGFTRAAARARRVKFGFVVHT